MEDMKPVWTIRIDAETIRIYRFGDDDYSIEWDLDDCSVRGTFMQIAIELLMELERTAKYGRED